MTVERFIKKLETIIWIEIVVYIIGSLVIGSLFYNPIKEISIIIFLKIYAIGSTILLCSLPVFSFILPLFFHRKLKSNFIHCTKENRKIIIEQIFILSFKKAFWISIIGILFSITIGMHISTNKKQDDKIFGDYNYEIIKKILEET